MHWDEYERPLVYPTVMSDQEKAAIFNQRLMELNEEFGGKGDARPLIALEVQVLCQNRCTRCLNQKEAQKSLRLLFVKERIEG